MSSVWEVGLLLACGGFGAGVAHLTRLPMWPITGGVVGAAIPSVWLFGEVTLPSQLSFVAQVIVGTALGASVLPGFFALLRRLFMPTIVVVIVIVGVGVSAGTALGGLGVLEAEVAYLGMLPGGVGELVAASQSIGADSALVAGIHLTRLLLTLWLLPLLVAWARRW